MEPQLSSIITNHVAIKHKAYVHSCPKRQWFAVSIFLREMSRYTDISSYCHTMDKPEMQRNEGHLKGGHSGQSGVVRGCCKMSRVNTALSSIHQFDNINFVSYNFNLL